ncbi:Hemerythrin HHE cation binding domain [Gulbenkiania indica]|uniref:Hemerythrin HHE cation binding domain n=2 Tax=Gulbenkiania TaxID=397456 RepID=A0A0K6GUQ8_9NEIS|nr:hemerythrin domain-containing protein [Gulbenkiania indica]TCW33878.1 hemerythrin HHE cation binding domain-containing protein [Gulbenkiania mobilis]CUA82247.1 Hemerythrin HHE cation binding domain [Gulbenkiania indica]
MTAVNRLIDEHRHCDDLFAATEAAVQAGRVGEAKEAFAGFRTQMEAHFRLEEERLFPAFEQATGIHGGPTQVMRSEHADMRALMDEMEASLSGTGLATFPGLAETLLILMQQHNMKEENILYPMCQAHVPDMGALLAGEPA